MSRRFTWILAAGLVVGSAYVPTIFAADQAAPVAPATSGISGPWHYEVEGRNGQKIAINMKLKQEGEKLTGTVSGMRGAETEITDGTVKNGEFSFKVVRKWNDNEMVTKYSGKLEGDVLKGKSEMERNGQAMVREFEAKRGEAPKAEPQP